MSVEDETTGTGTLAVTYVPASIEANFDALEERVSKMIEGYAEATYDLTDPEAVRQAKRDRTYLNGISREIEERRKAVKREYTRPLEAFESRAKAIVATVKGASDNIKSQLDEAEQRRRSAARAELEAHYTEIAELLAPVVPYERLHDDRWLLKSTSIVKAKEQLEGIVSKIATDWETLKGQRDGLGGYYELAERTFFAALDLGAALSAASEARASDERIARLKAETEAAREDAERRAREEAERAARERAEREALEREEAARAEEARTTETPAPAPIPDPDPAAAPAPDPTPAPAPTPARMPRPDERVPCVMVIDAASADQLREIGRFCATLEPRVRGRFVLGTLAEASARIERGDHGRR